MNVNVRYKCNVKKYHNCDINITTTGLVQHFKVLQLLVGARVILYLTMSSAPVTNFQCRHNGFGQDNCRHSEDVRVICCEYQHSSI